MKFITENDLRTQYRQFAFTDYQLEKDTRLTPGARQFLVDRRVTIISEKEDLSLFKRGGAVQREERACGDNYFDVLLHIKIRMLENLILTGAHDFLQQNNRLVQDLVRLQNKVNALHSPRTDCEKKKEGGTKKGERSEVEPVFELNAFHLHLANSAEILTLHRILCAVEEFSCFLYQEKALAARCVLVRQTEEVRQDVLRLLVLAEGGNNDEKQN